jgi:hypothetical protein
MAWTEVAFEIFALMLSQIILVLLDSSRLFFTWSQPAPNSMLVKDDNRIVKKSIYFFGVFVRDQQ